MNRRVEVPTPREGWLYPWANAFEVAAVLPTEKWTLVGGLMVQLHALAHGIAFVRPTMDIDMLLGIEMYTGVVGDTSAAMEQLGYDLHIPLTRKARVHRFVRGDDQIDVMTADHAKPERRQPLRNGRMFEVPGGTQAQDRTMILAVTSGDGALVDFTVPDELGALVLKGAGYITDPRERDRHLFDAAMLAATITDHATEVARLAGSDRKRLRRLNADLADPSHLAWQTLPREHRLPGQDTLRILSGRAAR
jgi:hypothetical protein